MENFVTNAFKNNVSILGIESRLIDLDCVKRAYRKQSKAYHPDVNPSGLQMIQMINNAYEAMLKEELPVDLDRMTNTDKPLDLGCNERLSDMISKVVDLEGIIVEIKGSWVWVSGGIDRWKKELKSAGFKKHSTKAFWMASPDNGKMKRKRYHKSTDDINRDYGSVRVQRSNRARLSA